MVNKARLTKTGPNDESIYIQVCRIRARIFPVSDGVLRQFCVELFVMTGVYGGAHLGGCKEYSAWNYWYITEF